MRMSLTSKLLTPRVCPALGSTRLHIVRLATHLSILQMEPPSMVQEKRHALGRSDTFLTSDHMKIQLDRIISAPTFRANLLSVHQLTSQNNCAVYLGSKGGAIVSSEYKVPERHIMAHERYEDGYKIDMKRAPDKSDAGAGGAKAAIAMTAEEPGTPVTPPSALEQPTNTQTPIVISVRGDQHTATQKTRSTPKTQKKSTKSKRAENITHVVPYPDHLPEVPAHKMKQVDEANSWHLPMNHTNNPYLQKMAKDPEYGLPASFAKSPLPIHCHACKIAHLQSAKHVGHVDRPPPGHTIAVDIAGPFKKTPPNQKYLLCLTELHTRMHITYVLKRKADAPQRIKDALKTVARHTGVTASKLRIDNANEFLTKDLQAFLHHQVTDISPTTPHTPQENAVAERWHRTLVSRIRATFDAARMPFARYWAMYALQ